MKSLSFEEMIHELLDSDNEVAEYFSCATEPLPKTIKRITKRISNDEFLTCTQNHNRSLQSPDSPTGESIPELKDTYYISREDTTEGLGKHRLHTAGLFYMQELAASIPSRLLPIKKGDIVLDMCAAPGGKSIQIRDNGAYVVSNEISGSRIIALQSNLNRIGVVESSVTSLQGGNRGNLLPEYFDHVLVDAPCSGEGTQFKTTASTKRRKESDIKKLSALQKELLLSACKSCKVGGYILYSTCTLNPRENEHVVQEALKQGNNALELVPITLNNISRGYTHFLGNELLSINDANKVARFRPHKQHTGGFFIALFKKTGPRNKQIQKTIQQQNIDLNYSHQLQNLVKDYLYANFGITIPENYLFIASKKQIYVCHSKSRDLLEKIPTKKHGIPILKRDGNKETIRPLHGLGQTLGKFATKNILKLALHEIEQYCQGLDIPASQENSDCTPSSAFPYRIIYYNNIPISITKKVDNTYKNKFIKL